MYYLVSPSHMFVNYITLLFLTPVLSCGPCMGLVLTLLLLSCDLYAGSLSVGPMGSH